MTVPAHKVEPVITDHMLSGAVHVLDSVLDDTHELADVQRIAREVLTEALSDPNRCRFCGGSLANVKPSASWCSAACRMAAYRLRQGARNRNEPRPRRPGGRQIAFGPGVRELALHFELTGIHPADKARVVAERVLTRALPRKQRMRSVS